MSDSSVVYVSNNFSYNPQPKSGSPKSSPWAVVKINAIHLLIDVYSESKLVTPEDNLNILGNFMEFVNNINYTPLIQMQFLS